MHVIGTAGHVDHGKSTLVVALTGINPDRLKEERERLMTIDLGFAWLKLSDEEEAGIIDVPGHRDFIENMLAGVTGIDAVLFVIAADEGVMPQTREHLAILDLLGVKAGIIALTKIDLIEDPEWIQMVEEDIRALTQATVLEGAPVIRVSALTGVGIPELKYQLNQILSRKPSRQNLGRPRLPVDRVFSITGFGTVVTGTLMDGEFHLGDEVEILPGEISGRIRGLQTHKKKENLAVPGSRTAINLTGIKSEHVRRGDVIVHSGSTYQTSTLVDVRIRVLPEINDRIRHNFEATLFVGTSEVQCRVRLLGVEELKSGDSGWLQLELKKPVVVEKGDRFILRKPSPGETLGGGWIVDAHPTSRHKRFNPEILARLEKLDSGSPSEIFLQTMLESGPARLIDLRNKARLDRNTADRVIGELYSGNQIIPLEQGEMISDSTVIVVATKTWEMLVQRVDDELVVFHQMYPLRRGMPRDQLKNYLRLSGNVFGLIVQKCIQDEIISEKDGCFQIPGRDVVFSGVQKEQIARLLARFTEMPYSPPPVKDCQNELGEELYRAIVEAGYLVQVSSEIVFQRSDYERLLVEVRDLLITNGTITVAEFRDRYRTSRRYALAFLEHLDSLKVTIRQGDMRTLA
jgi:selenocysteine-specific elongation factor